MIQFPFGGHPRARYVGLRSIGTSVNVTVTTLLGGRPFGKEAARWRRNGNWELGNHLKVDVAPLRILARQGTKSRSGFRVAVGCVPRSCTALILNVCCISGEYPFVPPLRCSMRCSRDRWNHGRRPTRRQLLLELLNAMNAMS